MCVAVLDKLMRGAVEAIMTTVGSSTVAKAHGGMRAASSLDGRSSSSRRLRSRSVVIPPRVITATGQGAGQVGEECL